MIRFSSWLAPYFRRFVQLKRAGGAAFDTQERLLARFDRFVGPRRRPPLRRQVLVDYLGSLAPLFARSRENAISLVWDALAHSQRHGAEIDLVARPPSPGGSLRRQRPQVIMLPEVERILVAARNLPPTGGLRSATTATLIGLLYATGIRIGEAHALDVGDLDIEAKVLTVRRGKFGKARLLPVRASTVQALQAYMAHPRRRAAKESGSPLFVSGRGRRLVHGVALPNFRAACHIAGIAQPYPRLHDLRHSYAVCRLADWYAQGRDVDSLLPILSTYLGHVSIENTRTYLTANGLLLDRAATIFAAKTTFLDEVRS
ncbi:MAG TPA: tyrosine-type recombinase/integrase [Solirubrobacteraceae bacterium]